MPPVIRQMVPGEELAAASLWTTTWRALQVSLGQEPTDFGPDAHEALATRYRYLLATGPGGCTVAQAGGDLVGLAVSLVRGDLYCLANLGVSPDWQGTGLGRRLLEAASDHGAAAARRFIASSPDPRAMALYVKAGYTLSPAMKALGRAPGPDAAVPAWLRCSDGSAGDLDAVDELDMALRGAARRADMEVMLSSGSELWLDQAGGYAVVGPDHISTMGAVDDRGAARLLGALLSGATGRALTAQWLTSHCPWAFSSAVAAGAVLEPHGALMTQGGLHFPSSFVPSGVFC